MGKSFKKTRTKNNSAKNKNKINRKVKLKNNKNYDKFIYYKPFSIILNKKIDMVNKLKTSKKRNSYKIKKIKDILNQFDLNESFFEYFFSLIADKLNKTENINIFIKYMFAMKFEERTKYQKGLFKYLNDEQKKEIKKMKMKTIFLNLLSDIQNLKMDNKTISSLSEINDLKESDKYYVTNKKYVIPLSYGNDEAIYQEYIYLLFHYLTSYGEVKLKNSIELLNLFIPIITSEEFKNHFEDRIIFNLMIDYIFILLFIGIILIIKKPKLKMSHNIFLKQKIKK